MRLIDGNQTEGRVADSMICHDMQQVKLALQQGFYFPEGYRDFPCIAFGNERSLIPLEYTSVQSLLEELTDIIAKYGDTYSDLRFEDVQECSCRGDCNCRPTYYITGRRDLTAEEIQFYKHKDEIDEQRIRQFELDQLKKLREKYPE